jgi:hypothetical protein
MLALRQRNDGELLLTTPRAARRRASRDESQSASSTKKTNELTHTFVDEQPKQRPWMAIDEQKQLLLRYPLFFRAVLYPDSYPSNIAHLGIQCGMGWYSLIEGLAREIEYELRGIWHEQVQFPASLADMDRALLHGHGVYRAMPVCTDITQVAGELVVVVLDGYLCGPDAWQRILKSIHNAIAKARHTCEVCGNAGQYREVYWHHVYCDHCIAPFADLDPAKSEAASSSQ